MTHDIELEAAPVVTAQRPVVPRVDLLPPEVRESSRVRLVQAGMVGAVLTAAAAVALGAWTASGQSADARADMLSAQAARAQADAAVAELAPVRQVYQQVETAEALVALARGTEVGWSQLLHDLSVEVPPNVWIETMSVTPPVAGGGATVSAGGLGSITYTGRGKSHDDVATWLETLESHPGLTDATFSASTLDQTMAQETVSFSATVNVGPEALRNGAPE